MHQALSRFFLRSLFACDLEILEFGVEVCEDGTITRSGGMFAVCSTGLLRTFATVGCCNILGTAIPGPVPPVSVNGGGYAEQTVGG